MQALVIAAVGQTVAVNDEGPTPPPGSVKAAVIAPSCDADGAVENPVGVLTALVAVGLKTIDEGRETR
jgi:hypothetical protein